MSEVERDDIGADLRAAMDAAPDVEVESHEDVAADLKQAIAETPAAVEAEPAQRPDGRDEKGRFAPKETKEIQTAAAVETPEAVAELQPPAKWKPEAKAAFLSAPPEMRQAFLDHQKELDTQASEIQPKAQRLEQFDAAIAPYKEKLALNGVDEITALKQLFAAQAMLDRDPVAGVLHLARSYGVTPQHLFAGFQQGQPQQGHQPQQGYQADPRLAQEVQQLKQFVQQQKESQERATAADIQSQIDVFKGDPKHTYFENVKEDMGVLIQAGKAKDLATAYDMAIWGRPDIRKLVMAQERAAEAAKEKETAAAKVAAAKKASGQVVGGPGPGAAVKISNPRNSISDDLMEAYREHTSA